MLGCSSHSTGTTIGEQPAVRECGGVLPTTQVPPYGSSQLSGSAREFFPQPRYHHRGAASCQGVRWSSSFKGQPSVRRRGKVQQCHKYFFLSIAETRRPYPSSRLTCAAPFSSTSRRRRRSRASRATSTGWTNSLLVGFLFIHLKLHLYTFVHFYPMLVVDEKGIRIRAFIGKTGESPIQKSPNSVPLSKR